MVGPLCKLA